MPPRSLVLSVLDFSFVIFLVKVVLFCSVSLRLAFLCYYYYYAVVFISGHANYRMRHPDGNVMGRFICCVVVLYWLSLSLLFI